MAVQNAFHVVYRSECVEIGDFRCTACNKLPSGDECSAAHSFALPRKGLFIKHVGRRSVVADANHAIFFNTHETYRISHPVPGGDDCTVFRIAPNVLIDAVGAHDPSVRDRPTRPFSFAHCPTDPAVFLFHRTLLTRLRRQKCDELAVDESVFDLLDALLSGAFRRHSRTPRRPVRPDTCRAHADLADAVKTTIAHRFAEPLMLDDLARAAHASPYHLSRIFRRETGLPIHRYLNRIRLRAALERIAEGEVSLTELALDLGFSSHSHLTDAFRREFKSPPSSLRHIHSVRLHEMSKILKA